LTEKWNWSCIKAQLTFQIYCGRKDDDDPQGDAYKETEKQLDVDYLLLLLLVEVRWICASSHPLVTYLYGTSQFEQKKSPE
jgi:hypothetical protein